jgi:hypothetical protein
MIATTLIYVAGLALFIVAGVALQALLDPAGRWLTPAAPAAGAAFLICLAHPLGFLLSGRVAALLVVLVIAALLAVGVWRRPRPRRLRAALALSGGEATALGLGAAAGLLLLGPVLAIGFPTTIAASIADGWARSVLTEWLFDNALIDSATSLATDRPVGRYSAVPPDLGAGFEYLVATVGTLVGRRAFETALPVATLAAPVALGGWAALHALLAGRPPRAWQAAVLAVGVAAPLFVLPLGENYLTQCFSLGLWPFAMAATYRFAQSPSVGSAVLAAIGLGAVGSVYPQLAPWIGPPALLLVLVLAERRVAALGLLALAVAVVAPIELVRGIRSVTTFSGQLTSNPDFPLYQAEQDLQLVLGGASQFTLTPGGGGPAVWQLVPSVVLMLGAAAIAAATLWTLRPAERRPLVALIAGVGAITGVLYVKYKFGDDYGYGTYKALLSGGALLAGLLVLTLASESAGLRPWRGLAVGVCLAIWVPVSAGILASQRNGAQGFREADRALIGELEQLPRGDVVLVEGAAENDVAFRMRLAGAYFAAAFDDRRVDGLGSTSSYLANGGGDAWRPQRPWRYVVAGDAPSAFSASRRTLWHAPPYRIQDAPVIDVTPYVPASGRFWITPPAGSPPSDQIGGPVELIVANRGDAGASAELELGLRALRRGQAVVIGGSQRVPLPAGRAIATKTTVNVPAGGTARVALDPGAPQLDAAGKATPLVTLTRVAAR